jgi:hypothetical protein
MHRSQRSPLAGLVTAQLFEAPQDYYTRYALDMVQDPPCQKLGSHAGAVGRRCGPLEGGASWEVLRSIGGVPVEEIKVALLRPFGTSQGHCYKA